jgi:HNH endonuclease
MEKRYPAKGLEGEYEVTRTGEVWSVARRVPYGSSGATRGVPAKRMSPNLVSNNGNRQGALMLSLGRKRRKRVSHIVLETFVGPRPEGQIARHGDDDPFNNSVENLCWGTHSENAHDAVRNGKHGMANRTRCSKGHELDGRTARQRYCKRCHKRSAKAIAERLKPCIIEGCDNPKIAGKGYRYCELHRRAG